MSASASSTRTVPIASAGASSSLPASRSLWRWAGSLGLLHVVLMVAGTVVRGAPVVHEGQEGIEHSFVEGDLTRVYTSGYLMTLALVVLVPVLVFLARQLGLSSEAGRWASSTGLAVGMVYVAVLAAALAAGAAAAWGLEHGLPLAHSLALNNIRNFAYLVGPTFLGAHAIAVAVAVRCDRRGTGITRWTRRWFVGGGLVVGVVLLGVIPAAAAGLNGSMVLWLLWWTGLSVLVLRWPGKPAPDASR